MRSRPQPPDHLTPFGVWLFDRWPWPTKERIESGQAFVGLKSPRGFMWAGTLTDWYHGYWPRLGVLYRRRSVWLLGFKIIQWKQFR